MGGAVDGDARAAAMTGPEDLADWQPYRPPWYPLDDNPQTIVLVASGDVVTKYEQWVRSLPPGELERLIAEYHAGAGR